MGTENVLVSNNTPSSVSVEGIVPLLVAVGEKNWPKGQIKRQAKGCICSLGRSSETTELEKRVDIYFGSFIAVFAPIGNIFSYFWS